MIYEEEIILAKKHKLIHIHTHELCVNHQNEPVSNFILQPLNFWIHFHAHFYWKRFRYHRSACAFCIFGRFSYRRLIFVEMGWVFSTNILVINGSFYMIFVWKLAMAATAVATVAVPAIECRKKLNALCSFSLLPPLSFHSLSLSHLNT